VVVAAARVKNLAPGRPSESADTRTWWAARRRIYNVVLVVAGLVAFLVWGLEVEFVLGDGPHAEVTVFTTVMQALGYLVFLGLANLCFGLGAIVEDIIKVTPSTVSGYRRIAFALGMAVSVAMPLAIPVMLVLMHGQRH
jgi:hypothetical protein